MLAEKLISIAGPCIDLRQRTEVIVIGESEAVATIAVQHRDGTPELRPVRFAVLLPEIFKQEETRANGEYVRHAHTGSAQHTQAVGLALK
jgi:hypothetical protein